MKTRESHPIEPLELMAYLDGELPRERAAAAAAHLEQCRECQSLAANLRGVSQELAAWQVGPSELEISPGITVAIEDHVTAQEAATRKRGRNWRPGRLRQWLFVSVTTVVALCLVLALSIPNLMRSKSDAEFAAKMAQKHVQTVEYQYDSLNKLASAAPSASQYGDYASENKLQSNSSLTLDGRVPAATENPKQTRALVLPTGPMVIRTAELTLTSNDIDHARSKLEDILKRHHGYLGELSVAGSQESARTLEATLRVPADQLDAAIAELKSLGRVDSESQKGEEVSQQYVDLQARLANARETEQTLLDILRNRTGKLSDVLQVEQEIASVREEIERMEAEKKNMEKQVAFSTVNMKVSEDFKQHVHVVPDSTSTRLRNAAVDGYETMVAGLINLLMFLVSAGPSVLLWGAVLFFPARWAWKKWRKRNQI